MYGGMSQEIRTRSRLNGYNIDFVPSAVAKQIGKSSNKWRKRDEIIKIKNRLWQMGLEI